MDTQLTRDYASFDESAAPNGEAQANPEFVEHVEHGREVYNRVLAGLENSLPNNNHLRPTQSSLLYNDHVNWHPCTVGVNAGMRVNNVSVRYSGPLNVYRKTNLSE